MLKRILYTFLLVSAVAFGSQAQSRKSSSSKPGNMLNLGVGVGFRGGLSGVPVMASYEIGVAPSFVLAPFVGFGTYRVRHGDYWVGNTYFEGHYHRRFYVPLGVRGQYYFDDLLGLNDKFDVYGGGALGLTIWGGSDLDHDYDNDYYDDGGISWLYLNAMIGARYHFNNKLSAYVDLSTGISTIGLSFKM